MLVSLHSDGNAENLQSARNGRCEVMGLAFLFFASSAPCNALPTQRPYGSHRFVPEESA